MTVANERYDAPSSPDTAAQQLPAARLILALLKRSRGAFALALVACVLNGIASVMLVATLNRALSQPSLADTSLAWRFGLCAGRRARDARALRRALRAPLAGHDGPVARARRATRGGGGVARRRAHWRRARAVRADRRCHQRLDAVLCAAQHRDARIDRVRLPGVSRVAVVAGVRARARRDRDRLAGYHTGDKRAIAALEAAGKSQDKLFGYLGALFAGAKELKLHQARARQFVDGQLGTAIGEVRDHRRRAFSAYAVGVGWIIFLFYMFLGAAAFWPTSACAPSPSAAGDAFSRFSCSCRAPRRSCRTVNAARVSLDRIEKVMAEFGDSPSTPPMAENASHTPFSTLALRGVTHSYFHERDERMFRIGPLI